MSGWMVVAVPVAALVVLLMHDFMAGLGEDRLWSDPALDDSEGIRHPAGGNVRDRAGRVSMDSVSRLADFREDPVSSPGESPEARSA